MCYETIGPHMHLEPTQEKAQFEGQLKQINAVLKKIYGS